jgi:hypothetical protein
LIQEQLEQRNQARMAMAISALMMTHQVAGKATRDAIFLSQFRPSALPTIVAVAAIAAVVMSIARGPMLVRGGPFRITAVSFAVSGVLQGGEWLLLRHYPRITACAIYVHYVALGAVLLSGFWSVMNESFDPRSAKSLFGRISGMGTLGGLCGGLLAERVAAWFSPSAVVLVLTVLHLACAGLLWRAFPAASATPRSPAADSSRTQLVDAARRYPFLLTLAGLVLAASAGTALLDFVFKAQAAQTMGRGAPLLRFFGLYYTATGLLTFLAQTAFTRFALQHAGLAISAGTLPAAIGLGSLVSLTTPGFRGMSGVRAIEIIARGSLYRSAYELFFTAVAPADKRAIKPVIDVGTDRLGDAVGAAGVTALLALAPGRYGPVLAAACGCSVVALLLAVRLQRGYLRALEKSLVNRAIELDPSMIEDSATRSVMMRSIVIPRPPLPAAPAQPGPARRPAPAADAFVRAAAELRSGDAERAIRTAGELGPGDWELAPLLIDLLAWDEAMPAARSALERMGPKITGMLVDALLDPDRDFAVRRRMPRVLAFLPSARSVDGLFAALEDQRFEVRFYAGRALWLLVRDHPDLALAPDRVWAAVNRELSMQKSVWQSHRLLDSRDAHDKEWFFDEELLDRADRNLEHLFTLLALELPVDAVRIAFRALHTDDRQLKGTAFEYLDSATPPQTRHLLLPLLEADVEARLRSAAGNGALDRLLATQARVNHTLNLGARAMETRR